MHNITNHAYFSSLSFVLSIESWSPFVSYILMNGRTFSQLKISIDKVRKVWKWKSKIKLFREPFVPGEIRSVTFLILIFFELDSCINQLISDRCCEPSYLPVSKSWFGVNGREFISFLPIFEVL